MAEVRRRAVRCYYCETVIDDDQYGPCPHCGGNLSVGTQILIVEGFPDGGCCDSNPAPYYMDGGITFRGVDSEGESLIPAVGWAYYTAWAYVNDTDEPAYPDDVVEELGPYDGPGEPIPPDADEIHRLYCPQDVEPRRWGGILGWFLGE